MNTTNTLYREMHRIGFQMNDLRRAMKLARGANRKRIDAEIDALEPILRAAQNAYVNAVNASSDRAYITGI